jgi:hypothetical protein
MRELLNEDRKKNRKCFIKSWENIDETERKEDNVW